MKSKNLRKFATLFSLVGTIGLTTSGGFVVKGYIENQNKIIYNDLKYDMKINIAQVKHSSYLTREEQEHIIAVLKEQLSNYKQKKISKEQYSQQTKKLTDDYIKIIEKRRVAPIKLDNQASNSSFSNSQLHLSEEQVQALAFYQKNTTNEEPIQISPEQEAIMRHYSLPVLEQIPGNGLTCLAPDGSLIFCTEEGTLDEEYIHYLMENTTCTGVSALEMIKENLIDEQIGDFIVKPVAECNMETENARAIYDRKEDKQVGQVSYVKTENGAIPIYWNTVYGYVANSLESYAVENHVCVMREQAKWK